MIAEFHNKISRSGSNLSDRLEDKLTGDFFGTIRYLPFELGLKIVLSNIHFQNEAATNHWETLLLNEKGYCCTFEFWPKNIEGEIDLILYLKDSLIGIEVKYLSGLSSEDEEEDINEISPEESRNQLARYSRMLDKINTVNDKYLIFLAPFGTATQVEKAIKSRPIISSNVSLGFLSWEGILDQLETIDTIALPEWQKLIINDLKQLLIHKGFVRFKGFHTIMEKKVNRESYHFNNTLQQKFNWPLEKFDWGNGYVFND